LLRPWTCLRDIVDPATQLFEANLIIRLIDGLAMARNPGNVGWMQNDHPVPESFSGQTSVLQRYDCGNNVTHMRLHRSGTLMPSNSSNAAMDQSRFDVQDEFHDAMQRNGAEFQMPLLSRHSISHLDRGSRTHELFTTILRSKDLGAVRSLIRSGIDIKLRDNKGNVQCIYGLVQQARVSH